MSREKKIIIEIIKGGIYTILGTFLGICINADNAMKIPLILSIVCIWGLAVTLFVLQSSKKKNVTVSSLDSLNVNARINNNMNRQRNQQDYSTKLNDNFHNDRIIMEKQNNKLNNPLDRKPISAEKREQREKNKKIAKKVVLINEEYKSLLEWSLEGQVSLIIGKSSEKEPVDIDLSGSAVAQMISKQHAVLNYTENGWYVDDIDSKNGTRVKKASQNSILDVMLVGAIEVEVGDIIYVANTMLQIQ